MRVPALFFSFGRNKTLQALYIYSYLSFKKSRHRGGGAHRMEEEEMQTALTKKSRSAFFVVVVVGCLFVVARGAASLIFIYYTAKKSVCLLLSNPSSRTKLCGKLGGNYSTRQNFSATLGAAGVEPSRENSYIDYFYLIDIFFLK